MIAPNERRDVVDKMAGGYAAATMRPVKSSHPEMVCNDPVLPENVEGLANILAGQLSDALDKVARMDDRLTGTGGCDDECKTPGYSGVVPTLHQCARRSADLLRALDTLAGRIVN